MGDGHHPRLGIKLLDEVQDDSGQDGVGTGQVVHGLDKIRRACLALLLDGLGRHVGAVHALSGIADPRDRLDRLLGLVADAVEALGYLVRADLLDVFVRVSVDLDHQPGLRALLLQLLDSHVDQRPGFDLVAAVRCGVDHVQLLAGDFVEQLLGA